MTAGAEGKQHLIRAGELALIEALLASPEHQATTDDITDRQDRAYADGGKWRGSIPRRLVQRGLIRKAGAVQSRRAHRNGGYVSLWEAVNVPGLIARREELRRLVPPTLPPSPGA